MSDMFYKCDAQGREAHKGEHFKKQYLPLSDIIWVIYVTSKTQGGVFFIVKIPKKELLMKLIMSSSLIKFQTPW